MRLGVFVCLALTVAPLAGVHATGETDLALHEDAAVTTVRAHCSGCHSVDYIQMNAPFMKREGWEAEVRKMIKVMGAPVPDSDVPALVDYLTRYYGAR